MGVVSRPVRFGLCAVALLVAAGCSGGHVVPGQNKAAEACRGSGTPAAVAATQAAAINPGYVTLAADENALVANESSQTSQISDGDPTDDADAAAVAGAVDLASPARQKVIADCASLGLPVTGG